MQACIVSIGRVWMPGQGRSSNAGSVCSATLRQAKSDLEAGLLGTRAAAVSSKPGYSWCTVQESSECPHLRCPLAGGGSSPSRRAERRREPPRRRNSHAWPGKLRRAAVAVLCAAGGRSPPGRRSSHARPGKLRRAAVAVPRAVGSPRRQWMGVVAARAPMRSAPPVIHHHVGPLLRATSVCCLLLRSPRSHKAEPEAEMWKFTWPKSIDVSISPFAFFWFRLIWLSLWKMRGCNRRFGDASFVFLLGWSVDWRKFRRGSCLLMGQGGCFIVSPPRYTLEVVDYRWVSSRSRTWTARNIRFR